RDIQCTEGLRALFRGLGQTLAGAIPARSINFYVYSTGKEFYSQLFNPTSSFQPHQDTSSLVHIFSAITAGIATSTATNPIWVIKTRLQLEIPTPNLISNQSIQTFLKPSIECMRRIYQQEGFLGFYRGLSASYLGVIEGTIQWTLYEKFKRFGRFKKQLTPLEVADAVCVQLTL
ncbi:mitochondrial carrier domain-containing protein, partial [Melampsora americana]